MSKKVLVLGRNGQLGSEVIRMLSSSDYDGLCPSEEDIDISQVNNVVSGRKESLKKARRVKFDEFYTLLSDIEDELKHYKNCFRGKVVYCNCDKVEDLDNAHSRRNSAFYTYFHDQFERLGLRALICSWWEEGSKELLGVRYCGPKLVGGKPQRFSFHDETSGSYDGPIARKLLDACDIVVTNPPFSLFKEFFKFTVESRKSYLMVAPGTSPTYKDVFPKLANDRCKVGYTGLTKFFTCEDRPEGVKCKFDKKMGCDVVSSNSMWLTNLQLDKWPEPLALWNVYEEGKFTHFHNLDNSIDVPSPRDIPKDWEGMIGTTVNFFRYYNPKQFKVWGLGVGNLFLPIPGAHRLDGKFIEDYFAAGGRGSYAPNFPILGYYKGGVAKIPFAKVVIQQRKYLKSKTEDQT